MAQAVGRSRPAPASCLLGLHYEAAVRGQHYFQRAAAGGLAAEAAVGSAIGNERGASLRKKLSKEPNGAWSWELTDEYRGIEGSAKGNSSTGVCGYSLGEGKSLSL
ncbi:MAG: hypothetical protein EOO63_17035 [Hymenobacter sp.]|nr:MAG: hypothetical protein EOO63_17035 [Hymenobacter sp.]